MANKKDPNRVNKDFTIRVRVTQDVREKIQKQSMEKGFKTMSDYIRSLVEDQSKPNDGTTA